MINSRDKGARGELEAVKMLRNLGFEDAERTAQRWGKGLSDVWCPDSLENVHIEVKFGYPADSFYHGSSRWRAACKQAENDAEGKAWCVLWRNHRRTDWQISWIPEGLHWPVTGEGDVLIQTVLRKLNSEPVND